ncbi:MAG: hypothetical protein GWQ05_15325, partial [Verrucomicrobiaceae bacterium]|nr:hypothetical protein [Verrucomicrobiaceae bacterium]
RIPRQHTGHSHNLTQLAFQPDGKFLASADADAFLLLWDPIKNDEAIDDLTLSSPTSCLRWGNGGELAAGPQDGTVVIFEVKALA